MTTRTEVKEKKSNNKSRASAKTRVQIETMTPIRRNEEEK